MSAFIHYQSVGEGCSPLGRRHEVTEGEASPPRNAPPVTLPSNVIYREANHFLRRVRRLRRTENDGRFRYREHQIGLQCFSHTVRRQAPYPTKRASPQRALCFDQRPTAGAAQWRLANRRHACLLLERCCMGVVSQITDLDNSSKPLPYKFSARFIVGDDTYTRVRHPVTFPMNAIQPRSKSIPPPPATFSWMG